MTALPHQTRLPRSSPAIGQVLGIDALHQLHRGATQPAQGPDDLDHDYMVRVAAAGFQRQLPGRKIKAQAVADALDCAGTVDEKFRRNARFDQSSNWRYDPRTHYATPHYPERLQQRVVTIQLGNFPQTSRQLHLDIAGANKDRGPNAVRLHIPAFGPRLHREGDRGEVLNLFCSAYGVASCTEYWGRRSRRRGMLATGVSSKNQSPTDLSLTTKTGSLTRLLRCSGRTNRGPRSIASPACASVSATANGTPLATSNRPVISFANSCARRTAGNGSLRSWTDQMSDGGATCSEPNGSQRRSIASNEFQLVQKMHRFKSRSESNQSQTARTATGCRAEVLRVGERSADFATARTKYSAPVVFSSADRLGIHQPRSNGQGRARYRAKCPAIRRSHSPFKTGMGQ